jgi:hypothetical protein
MRLLRAEVTWPNELEVADVNAMEAHMVEHVAGFGAELGVQILAELEVSERLASVRLKAALVWMKARGAPG